MEKKKSLKNAHVAKYCNAKTCPTTAALGYHVYQCTGDER